MSVLHKPPVVFDPTNVAHRTAYKNFRRRDAWGDAPRFVLDDQFNNVPDMIASRLLDYYMSIEFATQPKP